MPFDAVVDTELSTGIDETTTLLIRARGFLERGWCRGTLARDASGEDVDPASERAVAWCAYGALKAAGVTPYHPAIDHLRHVIGESIVRFNERQETVEPILAAFDRAIAAGGLR